jgi:hypothetical protein
VTAPSTGTSESYTNDVAYTNPHGSSALPLLPLLPLPPQPEPVVIVVAAAVAAAAGPSMKLVRLQVTATRSLPLDTSRAALRWPSLRARASRAA